MIGRGQMATWSVAGLLLLGVAVDWQTFHPPPEDPTAYQQAVREAATLAPLNFGDWEGQDGEVAREAVSMLKPNVIIQRVYHNRRDGRVISVLVVHCSDANDMLGHYPPVCYPANGYAKTDGTPMEWRVGDQVLDGREYLFTSAIPGQLAPRVVDDFMLLPDGRSVGSMATVRQFAKNRRMRLFGAGQMQVLTNPEMSVEDRKAVFTEVVQAYMPLIRAIRLGAVHDH